MYMNNGIWYILTLNLKCIFSFSNVLRFKNISTTGSYFYFEMHFIFCRSIIGDNKGKITILSDGHFNVLCRDFAIVYNKLGHFHSLPIQKLA